MMKALLIIAMSCLSLLACADEDAPLPQPEPIRQVRLLALGDSYTIGQNVAEADRWPNQLARKLAAGNVFVDSVRIIAKTGWRTDNLADAIATQQPDSNWNLVGLLIGVNNQYQGRPVSAYGPEFEALLQTSIALAGGNREHVFVLSIPDYGYTPFGQSNQPQISAAIDEFNAVNRAIALQYNVAYYDITPISREGFDRPDLVASDRLHPSGVQYAEWVDKYWMWIAEQLR